jgi:short subunit dehydrogenase-like uncharacterized protein
MARQRGPIALYGATGYTGRLVAKELADGGTDFVLSGRNQAKLEALAEELGRNMPCVAATVDDPDSLRSMLAGCAAVIDCAGPFAYYGEPVLKAAIETSTHYLDTAGEQPYMNLIFKRYGAEAERNGVAAIPAMGFDFVPGDMLASLTAEGMGRLECLSLAYTQRHFTPTHGTALSVLEAMKGGDVEYRRGAWRPAPAGFGRGRHDFGDGWGEKRMARYPSGEQITVPRHVDTANVRTSINASTLTGSDKLAPALPLIAHSLSLAARTPLLKVMSAAVRRAPEGPSPEGRRRVEFKIDCTARSATAIRRSSVTGIDVYGLTAASIAHGARIVAGRGFHGRGALAPSQAFDPSEFLTALDRFKVRWELGEPEPVPPGERGPAAEAVALAGR